MDAAAIFSWKLAIQGHRSRVQGLSLLIWDLLLTFDDEKQLIWRRPYTLPTYLFIWIRYIGISLNALGTIISLVFEISDETCFLWLCLEEWLGISLIISIGLILQLRIYALYDKSRKVAAFMIISFVAQIAIGCFILWPGAERGRVIAELVGNISRCKVVYTPKYAFLFWVTLIGFEFILFTLVGYKAFEYYFRPSPRFKERLRYALLQDSIYYTAIICVVYIYNLVNWMRHLPDSLDSSSGMTIALPCAVINRMMINIRKVCFESSNQEASYEADTSLELPYIQAESPETESHSAINYI